MQSVSVLEGSSGSRGDPESERGAGEAAEALLCGCCKDKEVLSEERGSQDGKDREV